MKLKLRAILWDSVNDFFYVAMTVLSAAAALLVLVAVFFAFLYAVFCVSH